MSECLRSNPEDAMQVSSNIHERMRGTSGLPGNTLQPLEGLQCSQCANECSIDEGQRGYCGLVGKPIRQDKKVWGNASKRCIAVILRCPSDKLCFTVVLSSSTVNKLET